MTKLIVAFLQACFLLVFSLPAAKAKASDLAPANADECTAFITGHGGSQADMINLLLEMPNEIVKQEKAQKHRKNMILRDDLAIRTRNSFVMADWRISCTRTEDYFLCHQQQTGEDETSTDGEAIHWNEARPQLPVTGETARDQAAAEAAEKLLQVARGNSFFMFVRHLVFADLANDVAAMDVLFKNNVVQEWFKKCEGQGLVETRLIRLQKRLGVIAAIHIGKAMALNKDTGKTVDKATITGDYCKLDQPMLQVIRKIYDQGNYKGAMKLVISNAWTKVFPDPVCRRSETVLWVADIYKKGHNPSGVRTWANHALKNYKTILNREQALVLAELFDSVDQGLEASECRKLADSKPARH